MKKILVVDDEESLRNLAAMELADEGYQTATAKNMRAARKSLKTFQPDLLVVDIRLGGESGLNLVEEVRRDHGPLPVILWSAYPDYQLEGAEVKADDFVVKSPDLAELKLKIRWAFEGGSNLTPSPESEEEMMYFLGSAD